MNVASKEAKPTLSPKALTPITNAPPLLKRVLCIYYLVQFKKDQTKVWALIDFGSEVNAMTPAYTKKLGFQNRKTNIQAQKINKPSLATYRIVIVMRQISDEFGRARFFQETFLLANISLDVILKILFRTFSNVVIFFQDKKITRRSYTVAKALPTICWVEIIDEKKFATAALNKNIKAFVVYVAFLDLGSKMRIHPAQEVQIVLLIAEEVAIPAEYLNFADVFS